MLKFINIMHLMYGGVMSLMVCLNYTTFLFFLGLVGIIWNKRNLMIMLLCMELMFFSIGLNFIMFSVYFYNITGQMMTLLMMTTAAAETTIGLSLLVIAYRLINKVTYNSLVSLRG